MTDRCAPPDGSPSGEYWVEFENRTKIVLRWRHDLAAWWFMGAWRTPDEIHFTAVRYLRPCRPDDAEARERLEDENKRLREALEDVAEHLEVSLDRLGVCGNGDGKDRKADEDSWGGSASLIRAKEALNAR